MAKTTSKTKQRQSQATKDVEEDIHDEFGINNILNGLDDFENGGDDQDDDEFGLNFQAQEAERVKKMMVIEQKVAEFKKKSAAQAQANVQQFANMVKERKGKQLEQWKDQISQITDSFDSRREKISTIISNLLFPNDTHESNNFTAAPPSHKDNPLYKHQQTVLSESEKLIAIAKALVLKTKELQNTAQALDVCDVDAEKAKMQLEFLDEAVKDRIVEVLFEGSDGDGNGYVGGGGGGGVGGKTVGWYEAARVVEDGMDDVLRGLPELRVDGMEVD